MNEEQTRCCAKSFYAGLGVLSGFCGRYLKESMELPEEGALLTPKEAKKWLTETLERLQDKELAEPLRSPFSLVSLGGAKGEAAFIEAAGLSAAALFPKPQREVRRTRPMAGLLAAVRSIPEPMLESWELWLDAWLSAAESVAWSLPSDEYAVPLSEAVRVESALSIAGEDTKLLLIQGDFQGIQDFIFTKGSETNRQSAKLLRGRSFYVSLVCEIAALAVLDRLELTSAQLINSAAGKFLVVAPDTEENRGKLVALRREFRAWFADNTLLTSQIALAFVSTDAGTLRGASSDFTLLMKRLFEENERQKLQSAGLDITESSVLPVTYPEGVSPYDNRLPQESRLCGDLIKIGEKLVKNRYLSVCRTEEKIPGALSLPIFGYRVTVSSEPGEVLQRGAHRIWDFGTAEKLTDAVFGGLPFKAFNGYVPRFKDAYEASDARYAGAGEGEETGGDALKTFSYLAREDREELNGKFEGIVALAALKGDVDSLGKIFREGIAGENLAKMLAVSRSLHWFFSLYLPVLCRAEYPNIYTVYAGGDDFFFVGPWLSAQRFAEKIHEAFGAYAANPQVHFSAGLVIVKPACPPPTMARLAEEALKRSKLGAGAAKNAVTMYGVTIPWSQYAKVRELGEKLDFFSGYLDLSSSYLYSLFEIMALAARRNDPKASIWRPRLYYSTSRMLARKKADEAVSRDFLTFITQAVSEHSAAVRIPLSTLFYRRRNS